MQIQSFEERLCEINSVIISTASTAAKALEAGRPDGEINANIDFLRELFRRREILVHERRRNEP